MRSSKRACTTKVMTIVGTRPELIKLALVIKELDQHTDHILVHTGQNFDFELNEIFFNDLGLRKPNYFLECAGKTAMETIGQVLIKTDDLIDRVQPDAVLIYGDTNSCLASIAIKRKRIPLFHMEAGNRCFDARVPEELNRKLVDHLSDINMPLTEHGRRYLLAEGLPAHRVIKTGSCMKEVLEHYKDPIENSQVLNQLGLARQKYFVVSAHREENVDNPKVLNALVQTLNSLVQEYDCPAIFSMHPRTRKRLEADSRLTLDPQIKALKPLGFHDYIHLQKEALCVLSDSGTLMEEAALLGFRAVHLRESFERPEGMEVGTLVVCPVDSPRFREAVELVLKQENTPHTNLVADYQAPQVSKTVVRVILSYIDTIRRQTWYDESV